MEELANKYFQGRISPGEERLLWEWVNASAENLNKFREIKSSWKSSYVPDETVELSYEKFMTQWKVQKRAAVMQYFRWVAAAVAIIILGAAVRLYLPGETVDLVVPNGENSQVRLSDGTVVHVNSGSKLSYPSRFALFKRDVKLEGEAFFEVAKDRFRPFTVSVDDCCFRVLGTKFNISSYEREPLTAVLVEGSLQFSAGPRSILMTPGDLITHEGNETTVSKVDPELYCGWMNGMIVLNRINLVQLLDKIEREKNVEISLDTRNFDDRTLRASFTKDDPVEGILKTITGIFNLGYYCSDGVWHITENKR